MRHTDTEHSRRLFKAVCGILQEKGNDLLAVACYLSCNVGTAWNSNIVTISIKHGRCSEWGQRSSSASLESKRSSPCCSLHPRSPLMRSAPVRARRRAGVNMRTKWQVSGPVMTRNPLAVGISGEPRPQLSTAFVILHILHNQPNSRSFLCENTHDRNDFPPNFRSELRLRTIPPPGVAWAEWSPARSPGSGSFTILHHKLTN